MARGLAAVLVGIALLAGCGGDDDDDGGTGDAPQSADQVTLEQYHQIKKGWSDDEVRDLVGDPKRTDTAKVKGLGSAECWYYGGVAPEPTTQICFESGQVGFKTQYVEKK